MNGKGSKPRPIQIPLDEFYENFDLIFRKKLSKNKKDKTQTQKTENKKQEN